MTHLYPVMLTPKELLEKFTSVDAQEYLRVTARKIKGDPDFLYLWISNDNPLEIIAAAWVFPGDDVVEVVHLTINDVQFIPIRLAPPRPV